MTLKQTAIDALADWNDPASANSGLNNAREHFNNFLNLATIADDWSKDLGHLASWLVTVDGLSFAVTYENGPGAKPSVAYIANSGTPQQWYWAIESLVSLAYVCGINDIW